MKIINLTPHAIRVRFDESNVAEPLDSDIVIQPESAPARLDQTSIVVAEINGIPVKKTVFGEIYNLPDPDGESFYVVSMPVAQRAAQLGRDDVASPNTAPKQDIRYPADHKLAGLTFAVRGFQQF